jgi:hypothetical protein
VSHNIVDSQHGASHGKLDKILAEVERYCHEVSLVQEESETAPGGEHIAPKINFSVRCLLCNPVA